MLGVVIAVLVVLGLAFVASSFLGKKKLTPQQVKELINQKVVIVTGAARGLGKALAEEFIRNGSKVVIVDLKEDLLEQTKKELIEISSPESVVALAGDLSKKEFSKQVIETTVSKFGKIDILFSNHGIFPVKPIDDFSVEDIEQVLQVNFLGAVYLAKYAMDHIKKTKGSIAVTSSMSGKLAIRNSSSYCASKHALLGFFDTVRVELAAAGVQVTIVCPGGMRTEMIKEAYGTYTPNEKVKFYTPEELAPGIIEAVAARKREHYTEGFLRVLGLTRALFPQTIDNFLDKY